MLDSPTLAFGEWCYGIESKACSMDMDYEHHTTQQRHEHEEVKEEQPTHRVVINELGS